MITIEFLGPIGKKPIEIDIKTLDQLGELLNNDESLKQWLQNSAVTVNDVMVKDKSIELKSGDKVSLLPPVCGG